MRGQRALNALEQLRASGWYAADWDWIRFRIDRGSEIFIDVEDLLDPAVEPVHKPIMLEWIMRHPDGQLPLEPPKSFDIGALQAERAAAEQSLIVPPIESIQGG